MRRGGQHQRMFGPISATYVILSFHRTCGLTKGLGGARSEPRDAHPPEDVARCEATHASSKMERAQRERLRERSKMEHRPSGGRRAGSGYAHRIVVLQRGGR
jgi:hypothetical protein